MIFSSLINYSVMSSSYLIVAIVVWPEILLTRKVATDAMMLIRSALIVTAVLVIVVDIQQTSFALHDSNLDANTWIAQDNSTEVNTIDLNTPINQTVSGGAAASPDAAAAAEPEPTSTPDDEGEDEEESASDDGEEDEGDEETDEE
jgi:ribosomal protein L12E/L44/L45/RPP1/RPP2